ncbi:hypothetical protein HBI81_243630 [Parastagonospora nodorum]|nr:hypothetical protein HBI18_249850 [Parastagonospora nodorum]KAH6511577.1 hypothetical protein HBI81_243630 [Parastagonospora nodorum]
MKSDDWNLRSYDGSARLSDSGSFDKTGKCSAERDGGNTCCASPRTALRRTSCASAVGTQACVMVDFLVVVL